MALAATLVVLSLWLQGCICQDASSPWTVREFRGVWVATVADIDWPLSSHATPAQQQQQLDDIVTTANRLHFNALVFQVRSVGDAMYNSSLEPWSAYLTGTQGNAPSPYYDPLEYLINRAHEKGIEVHAWFNPYRARSGSSSRSGLAPNHMANRYPQYAYAYGNNLWFDPGVSAVQDHVVAVFSDVVTRYDVDGVHMDDYFYPYPVSGLDFPDSHSYNTYTAHGGALSKADWRTDNINRLIQRLNSDVHKIKPHIKFGIAPFGIWKSGYPHGIRGFSAVDSMFADSKRWLHDAWVDYLSPQLYWRIDPPQQSYPDLLEWWLQQNPHQRHVYVGNYASAIQVHQWDVSELINQVEISRSHRDTYSLGNLQFSWKHFRLNTKSIADEFLDKLYTSPALPPSMPWLNVSQSSAPSDVRSQGKTITWSAPSGGGTFYWSVYLQSADVYNLIDVLPRDILHYEVIQNGVYAIRGVNRAGIESSEATLKVDDKSGAVVIG